MIAFLAFQALVFAGWIVLTASILLGVSARAVRGRPESPEGPVRLSDAATAYFSDPLTLYRRRVWIGTTCLLAACVVISGVIFVQL